MDFEGVLCSNFKSVDDYCENDAVDIQDGEYVCDKHMVKYWHED